MTGFNFPGGGVVTSPNAPEELPSLLQQIELQSKLFAEGDAEARLKLVDTARSLSQAMETPRETLLRYCWGQPAAYASVESCVQLGIFPILAQSERPQSAVELAKATGAEVELVARLLKHLAASGVIVETGSDEYRPNGLSSALAVQRYSDSWPCLNGCAIAALHALPNWLQRNQFRTPTEARNAPFQLGYKTDLAFFEFLSRSPDYPDLNSKFNNFMSIYHQGRPSWMDMGFYPVHDRLIQGARSGKNDVFLVDVGGNKGHDLDEFRSKWPDFPGRLIVQDQPHVLNEIETLHPAIEPMAHDFFTEQPIKGARAYFLHSVLHDWNDEACKKILTQIAVAMEPNYSKVLINENVIPNTDANWQATSEDIVMMVDCAAKERTAGQWYQLVESAGLKVSKIWTLQASSESLIECELA